MPFQVIRKKVKPLHFLEMDSKQQATLRCYKIVDGVMLICLCLIPLMPRLGKLSLFKIEGGKPVFIQYLTQEHWEDDAYLSSLLK